MPMPLVRCVAVAALLAMGGCAPSDVTAVTIPASSGATPAAPRTLRRVHETATPEHPLDAWMGTSVDDVVRVRVVDGTGRPVSGLAVRFTHGQAPAPRLDTLVVSDADGVAALGAWALPARDTSDVLLHVDATLPDGESAGPMNTTSNSTPERSDARSDGQRTVRFTVRAWRDLARFGGRGPLVLTRLPMARSSLEAVLPLGTFGAHDALPSADAVLVPTPGALPIVHAMADGLITEIDHAAGVVTLRVRDHARIRLGGVALRRDLWVGRIVRAGDSLGSMELASDRVGLTMRVLDASSSRTGWVRPERYGARRHAAFFARYLVDSLRSHVFGLVRRAAPDLDGRIDYDQAGRLVGTWFDASAPSITHATTTDASITGLSSSHAQQVAEFDPSASVAPVALTFAYDAERPGQVRIAAGSALAAMLGVRGVRAIAWEDPDPASVDISTGLVRYHLYAADDALRLGVADRVLLVQLLSDNRLRAEVVSANGGDQSRFTARAIELIR